jgi:uncharacterized membrane protein
MNKNAIIATVVGTVVLFVLGYVIWGMVFVDFFEANVGAATNVAREAPIIWAQILGCVLYGAAITLAIQGKGESADVMAGLTTGAIVGVLIWGTADITLFSINQVNNLTGTIVDIVLEAVRGGITGAVVALTLSKVKA